MIDAKLNDFKNDARLDGQWINLIGKVLFIENSPVL